MHCPPTAQLKREEWMKKVSFRWWRNATLVAMATVGCSGGDRPPATVLQPGMNIIEARPDWGINAAYLKDGHVVYLQTRIGKLTPAEYHVGDPSVPLHEVDVRYVDEVGNTFMMQRGGDEFIDSSWS